MSDSISIFFEAWQLESAEVRLKRITDAVTANIQYDDPRTPETIDGIFQATGRPENLSTR